LTIQTNGTSKRILAGVITALLIGLITQVFINTGRISVLEATTKAFEKSLATTATHMETNRLENRSDHQAILIKLDGIQREIVKK
jgi:uncharacterized membrane protein YraQ (UPF0718 family)